MATAQVGDDFSFVYSDWDEGIEPWRFNLPAGENSNPVSAQTVLDRPLFRAGETVHMKHFLRRQTMEGFGLLPASDRPSTLIVEHSGSEKKYEVPLKWFPMERPKPVGPSLKKLIWACTISQWNSRTSNKDGKAFSPWVISAWRNFVFPF